MKKMWKGHVRGLAGDKYLISEDRTSLKPRDARTLPNLPYVKIIL